MKKGKRVWEKIRDHLRNEWLDCRVYAMAAFAICFGDGRKMPALHKSLSEQAARIAKKLQAAIETQNNNEPPDDGDDSSNNPPPAPPAPRIPDSGSGRGGFRIPRGSGRY
jgi:phage terminase large subunit GpA-like protein